MCGKMGGACEQCLAPRLLNFWRSEAQVIYLYEKHEKRFARSYKDSVAVVV